MPLDLDTCTLYTGMQVLRWREGEEEKMSLTLAQAGPFGEQATTQIFVEDGCTPWRRSR
jgi:hypothetical protein